MINGKIANLIERLYAGDQIAAAKLITLVESSDQKEDVIQAISNRTGNAYVVGITGSPGVGKSTLTDKLVKKLRSLNYKIGIIAVDPTSPFSGGAILGDRIRLQKHSTDDGVFIRSMASRGHLGGISTATSDGVKVLDAFGCDYIFIETVGVGQSEIEIIKNVDTTILILIPGMGDEIQAIKAGIMEIADVFVVNKADKDGVGRTVLEIEMLQNLNDISKYRASIQKVIARDNIGIDELVKKIKDHESHLKNNDLFHKNRKKRLEMELKQSIHDKLLKKTARIFEENYELASLIDDLYNSKKDIYSAANSIISQIVK